MEPDAIRRCPHCHRDTRPIGTPPVCGHCGHRMPNPHGDPRRQHTEDARRRRPQ